VALCVLSCLTAHSPTQGVRNKRNAGNCQCAYDTGRRLAETSRQSKS